MQLQLTEDQRLLRDSLDRFLADRYGFEQRRAHQRQAAGYNREIWSAFAELGLLGLLLPAEQDGFGGSFVDAMVVMESFGRALVVEPYLPSLLLAGRCISLAGDAAQRARLLPGLIAGELVLAFAHAEPQARYDLADVETTARRQANGWVLDGRKSLVQAGASADWLVVSARTAGATRDANGISLFLVPRGAPGLVLRDYATHDGLHAADLRLDGLRLPADALLGAPAEALPLIERLVDGAIAGLVAELVGIMSALQALTLDHIRTRVQFGRPIGSNQVLQHRVVDMTMAIEQARSMAILAAIEADAPDPRRRRLAISTAKTVAGQAATQVARDAVQLHGGMGITLDHPVGHYFKRVAAIEASLGNGAHHLGLVAAGGGLANALP